MLEAKGLAPLYRFLFSRLRSLYSIIRDLCESLLTTCKFIFEGDQTQGMEVEVWKFQ